MGSSFSKAIVRKPAETVVNGISSANLGKPNYTLAKKQHIAYTQILKDLGLSVEVLDEQEEFPDSVFVEDVAVLTERCAIVTNPAAPSRKDEKDLIISTLQKYYPSKDIKRITGGNLEGGDVMRVGNHFYIGLSKRSDDLGAKELTSILGEYGYSASTVNVDTVLHLKTGVTYLGNNTILAKAEFTNRKELSGFNTLQVEDDEAYAANSILINGKLLIAAGFPKTKAMLEEHGYETIEVELTEFQKLDGGLTCLSLRF